MTGTGEVADSHFHIWDLTRFPHDWLAEAPALHRSIGATEYRDETRGLAVVQSVVIEAYVNRPHALDETFWMLEQAKHHPWIAAVVGAVYLENPGADEVLARLADQPKFKGVRRLFDEEPDDAFPARQDVVRGIERLGRYNFSFDICVRASQLKACINLVKLLPGVRFVLDHGGKPSIREGQWQPWADQIAELASYPNLCCKLSGLATEAGRERATLADLEPYIAHIVQEFGAERVLFGTDWPVCLATVSAGDWLSLCRSFLEALQPLEKEAIFFGNCRRFYQMS